MNETTEMWRSFRQERQAKAEQRRLQAEQDFPTAAHRADDLGLLLRKCLGQQYQLSAPGRNWLINLYPGNQRIYHDQARPRGPRLRVSRPWTLMDVVNAAKGEHS